LVKKFNEKKKDKVLVKPDPWGSRCRDVYGRWAPKELCGYNKIKVKK